MTAAAVNIEPQAAAPRYCPLVLIVAAVAGGIVVDRSYPLPLVAWWLAGFVLVCAWWTIWIKGRLNLASWILLLSAAAVGGAWHHAYWHVYPANEISRMMRERSR